MKKIVLGVTLASLVVFTLALVTTQAYADEKPNGDRGHEEDRNGRLFNPDNELSNSACGKKLGSPVIEVTQKVQNDADSGETGNYWAFDYYTRHIKVWQTVAPGETTPGTYCAIVTYDGSFYAIPGQVGPGNRPAGALINTSTDEPVHGSMTGGRRATITGTLLATPTWKTHGSVGTTNYQCNISGTCTGLVSWVNQYFVSGASYTDDWWGWQYRGGSHGTWINAVTGNSGNIL